MRQALSDRSQFQPAQASRRRTTTAERLEQAGQDPLFRLRLAILRQRLDF